MVLNPTEGRWRVVRWTTEVGEAELGNLALRGGDVSLATMGQVK